jgi:hypothetical protein
MSLGVKIGIGVGVTIVVLVLLAFALLYCRRRRKPINQHVQRTSLVESGTTGKRVSELEGKNIPHELDPVEKGNQVSELPMSDNARAPTNTAEPEIAVRFLPELSAEVPPELHGQSLNTPAVHTTQTTSNGGRSSEEYLNRLRTQQAQLESRRQRLLELAEVEEQQAAIQRQIDMLERGGVGTQ